MPTITFTIKQNEQGGLSAHPSPQTATVKNTTIEYVLSKSVSNGTVFTGFESNDSEQQLGEYKIAEGGKAMSIPNANTKPETLQITVLLSSSSSEGPLRASSEVQNDPP